MLPTSKLTAVVDSPGVQSNSIGIAFNEKNQHLAKVAGKSLEAQFETTGGEFLLVLTDGCPFEETLRIALLSAELESVDELEYAAAYESLIVKNVKSISQSKLEIACGNQRHFQVQLFEKPLSLLRGFASKTSRSSISKRKRIALTPKPT